jgi:putative transposase
MIEAGAHLWRCMAYVELNMVRAGVVKHPGDGPWCSFAEWMGQRQRYKLVNPTALLSLLGKSDLEVFQENFQRLIDENILRDDCRRQAQWTESIAVGSPEFIRQVAGETEWRRRLKVEELPDQAWILKDEPLDTKNEAQNRI